MSKLIKADPATIKVMRKMAIRAMSLLERDGLRQDAAAMSEAIDLVALEAVKELIAINNQFSHERIKP